LTFFPLGEFALSCQHLEQGLAHYNLQKHRSLVFLYGQDPGVSSLSFMARVLWIQGYPDQALGKVREALMLAQDLVHPYSLSLALALENTVWLHRHRREIQAVQAQTETLITLSREKGFSLFWAIGATYQGWAMVEQGQGEKGIAQIRQSLAALTSTGAKTFESDYLTLLAVSYRKLGRQERGQKVLAEAFKTINKTGERWYEAELYRLKGELMLQRGTRDWGLGTRSSSPQPPSFKPQIPEERLREAEGYFHKAIDIAQKQQAKSWELRTATSLARLWQSQDKPSEARDLLAPVYNWFTEGFDTADLKDAKALLEELSH
jgi:predicted ATPase